MYVNEIFKYKNIEYTKLNILCDICIFNDFLILKNVYKLKNDFRLKKHEFGYRN